MSRAGARVVWTAASWVCTRPTTWSPSNTDAEPRPAALPQPGLPGPVQSQRSAFSSLPCPLSNGTEVLHVVVVFWPSILLLLKAFPCSSKPPVLYVWDRGRVRGAGEVPPVAHLTVDRFLTCQSKSRYGTGSVLDDDATRTIGR